MEVAVIDGTGAEQAGRVDPFLGSVYRWFNEGLTAHPKFHWANGQTRCQQGRPPQIIGVLDLAFYGGSDHPGAS